MRESQYQAYLIGKLQSIFPEAIIIKNDAGYRQGLPDLLILFRGWWAMLEVKASKQAQTQPNQEYYIQKFNEMSYATFIFPENEDEVIDDLQQAIRSCR